MDGQEKRLSVERFHEHPVGPQREGIRPPVEQALLPAPAHGDDLGFCRYLFHLHEDLEPVLFWHEEIGHHDVGRLPMPERHPFAAVRSVEDRMARPLQDDPHNLAER